MFRNLIWTKYDAITSEFCQHCIDKFEEDERKYPGRVGEYRRIDADIKLSMDLQISKLSGWESETEVFYQSLNEGLLEYLESIQNEHDYFFPFYSLDHISDSGYQIQRTQPGEFYIWHSDAIAEFSKVRQLTYIWYLNDVYEDGYTEFCDGTRIQPECGKILIFPATWTYVHRGYPPKSETKYISTGWIYSSLQPQHL